MIRREKKRKKGGGGRRRGRQRGGAIFTLSFLVTCLIWATKAAVVATRVARVGAAAYRLVRGASKVVKLVKHLSRAGRVAGRVAKRAGGKRGLDKLDNLDLVSGEGEEGKGKQQRRRQIVAASPWNGKKFHRRLEEKRSAMIKREREKARRRRVSNMERMADAADASQQYFRRGINVVSQSNEEARKRLDARRKLLMLRK